MDCLKAEQTLAVICLRGDSTRIRSPERVTRVHRDTIGRLLIRAVATARRSSTRRSTPISGDLFAGVMAGGAPGGRAR